MRTSAGSDVEYAFLRAPGQMPGAIRAFDWSTTPLGPISSWPVSLRSAVGLMLASHFPKAVIWGPSLTTLYNDAFLPILGSKPAPLGRPFNEIWSEVWPQVEAIQQKAFAGEATFIEDFPLVIERNGQPEHAYFTFCYSPLLDDDGNVAGMLDTVIETTGKMAALRDVKLINGELEHRIRNTLAIVGGIAHQTFRFAGSLTEARDMFNARLAALGNAHSALTQSNWASTPIELLLRKSLSPYQSAGNQITLEGPALDIPPQKGLTLSLAINELAANALKHGALSTPDGHVSVQWSADHPPALEGFALNWMERGGPPVQPPNRTGFGTFLLQALAGAFNGTAAADYAPEGLTFRLSTPPAVMPTAVQAGISSR